MASFMYKRSKRTRNAAAIVLAAVLCLTGYKGYISWQKTDLYAKGVELQAAGNELEAQQAYSKAQQIRIIDYKETETAAALASLNPAAALKSWFTSLSTDLKAAENVNDITLLLKTYNTYQTKASEIAALDEASQKRFAEMSASEQMEERFNNAFAYAKQLLVKSLESDISKKTFNGDNNIAYLLQLPAAYYKDENTKKLELNKLLERYDQARLDTSSKTKSIGEVLKEVAGIRKFYDTNHVEAAWLQPKLESYAQATLSKLEKNDLKGFIAAALLFQTSSELGGPSSKINTYIQTTIRKQFERAEQLATTQKFADAVALYKVLNEYKDTNKEVSELDQRWLEADPQQLLRKAAGTELTFTNVISNKGQAGAKLTAVGVLDNKTLVLARLLADQKIEMSRTAIDQGITVKSIQWSDQIGKKKEISSLLIEAASKTRKVRYLAYEVNTPELFKVLDVEADKIDYDPTGAIIMDNPTGDGAGQKAVYEYRNGRYAFVKTMADTKLGGAPLDIPLTEMISHKNEKIRFQGTITSVDDNHAMIQLNNGYVLLTGNVRFKKGPTTITGIYTGSEEVKKTPAPVTEYRVTVLELAP
ncbi:hypothetical protein OB236_01240 [Paenibacillus sp. WQ 127069]|uniref:SbsC C-terminal domain-containing protein n=1 Tax=Paenibacillus baimaensis TaxID=2982185 RepID=A0ABT2U7Y4_9BACL|nr:hypothetical protein [Paenibacillus sp. WQ 127069]MCU6790738.1 hypothetical protein [Paenibacillus sp. WQ 127069]